MTHDELLTVINAQPLSPESVGLIRAVKAIAELHQPIQCQPPIDHISLCQGCDGHWHYPCPTIQAIEKAIA